MSVMIRGQYTHSIDAKGRTSLPSRYRDQLMAAGDMRLVLAPALHDPCIHVYPLAGWEELERKVASLPQFDDWVVQLRRQYVSAAVDSDLDKQGRVLIPPQFREHAGLSREVLWAGVGNKAELWAKERWAQATRMSAEQLNQLKQRMGEWGL